MERSVLAMPVTPFHVGPAVLVKAVAPRWFSLGVFALVQVVIDIEPVWNILRGRYPVHAHLHTLVGATLVGLAAALPGKYLVSAVNAVVRLRLADEAGIPPWLLAQFGPVPWPAALLGALAGGLSHPLLDALIHPDVAPFAPWRPGNPFYLRGSFVWVHVACALIGALGALAWVAAARRRS